MSSTSFSNSLAHSSSSSKSEPRFAFIDKRIIDFGDISSGDTLRCSVRFKNLGDSVMEIKELIKDCNCTSVEVDKNNFKKGEIGTAKVVVDTKGKKGLNVVVAQIITKDSPRPNIIKITFNVL